MLIFVGQLLDIEGKENFIFHPLSHLFFLQIKSLVQCLSLRVLQSLSGALFLV